MNQITIIANAVARSSEVTQKVQNVKWNMPDTEIPKLGEQYLKKIQGWRKHHCRFCDKEFKLNDRLTRVTTSNGVKYYHFECWNDLLH